MKMKNRTLIGIVCIILAVAVTFLVSPLVNRVSEQKTDVIRFTKDISHGSKIVETDIEIVKLSKNSVPEKALKTKDAVVGKYAKADLFKGDLATEIKITDDENSVENIFGSLNGDKVAMSITINTFAGDNAFAINSRGSSLHKIISIFSPLSSFTIAFTRQPF